MNYGMSPMYPQPSQGYQQGNQLMSQSQPQWQPAGAAMPYNYNPTSQNSYAAPPTSQMSVDWIQGGVNSANAYPKPAPGCGVILMDSNEDKFYIKKTDMSGFPMPLRVFSYREEMQQAESQTGRQSAMPDMSQYVTKDEIENLLKKYMNPAKEK